MVGIGVFMNSYIHAITHVTFKAKSVKREAWSVKREAWGYTSGGALLGFPCFYFRMLSHIEVNLEHAFSLR